jgi:hypothetical protein
MPPELKTIARFLIDAFDVDMQLFMGRALARLKDTPAGMTLATWAQSNPLAFEALLRLISGYAQRLPRDSSLLMQAVSDQLARLPVEVSRTIGPESNAGTSPESGPFDAPEFRKQYELALEGLTDEQLAQVARLSPPRIREWVATPARLRPLLLRKWSEEKPPLQAFWYHPSTQKVVTSLADRMKTRIEFLRNKPKIS